jgi:16S rRNA (cytidine1402-2'-O)-methyltransferase
MGVEVKAVPGASAIVAALSVSGLSPDRFLFYGFLPQKRGKRRKVLFELLAQPFPVVFFESPRRLVDTIRDISEIAEGREVVLAKEMTKMYEEIQRGRADEILSRIPEEVKGEYTIIVAGNRPGSKG